MGVFEGMDIYLLISPLVLYVAAVNGGVVFLYLLACSHTYII